VTHHLSRSQLERFCVSALAEDELTAVALHVAECSECHQRFVEELKHQIGLGPSTFTLAPEFWFQHDHLDFDQLVDLADEKLDPSTREIIDIHLRTCERCREDVRSFLAFRKADEGDTAESGSEEE
jgi:anti-sigma factor RsiW